MKNTFIAAAIFLAANLFLSLSFAQSKGQSDYAVGDRLSAAAGKSDGFREIEWDDLIPPDWMPEKLFEDLFNDTNLDTLTDTGEHRSPSVLANGSTDEFLKQDRLADSSPADEPGLAPPESMARADRRL